MAAEHYLNGHEQCSSSCYKWILIIFSPFTFAFLSFVPFLCDCSSANLVSSIAPLLSHIFSILEPPYFTLDFVIVFPIHFFFFLHPLPAPFCLCARSPCEWACAYVSSTCPAFARFYSIYLRIWLCGQYWEHSVAYIKFSRQSITLCLTREKKESEGIVCVRACVRETILCVFYTRHIMSLSEQ